MSDALKTPKPRLAGRGARPSVILMTSRRPGPSQPRQRIVALAVAVASTLAWAAMLQFVLGAS